MERQKGPCKLSSTTNELLNMQCIFDLIKIYISLVALARFKLFFCVSRQSGFECALKCEFPTKLCAMMIPVTSQEDADYFLIANL